jgi:hypothetical protein
MGKVILEFDAVEEQEDISCALNGYKYKLALWTLDNDLRGKIKYSPDDASEDTINAFEKAREMLREAIGEYNLTLD